MNSFRFLYFGLTPLSSTTVCMPRFFPLSHRDPRRSAMIKEEDAFSLSLYSGDLHFMFSYLFHVIFKLHLAAVLTSKSTLICNKLCGDTRLSNHSRTCRRQTNTRKHTFHAFFSSRGRFSRANGTHTHTIYVSVLTHPFEIVASVIAICRHSFVFTRIESVLPKSYSDAHMGCTRGRVAENAPAHVCVSA